MKKLSNWLLTGAALAVAYGCQPKKPQEEDPSSKKGQCGGCQEQSALEKTPEALSPKVEVSALPSTPVIESTQSAELIVEEKYNAESTLSLLEEEVAKEAVEEAASSSPVAADTSESETPSEIASPKLPSESFPEKEIEGTQAASK